ncbi:MAG TPA: hypothetical protein VFK41_13325 [Nocardioidaceae bacterium]|nr:hypothetical protein [Nocardioidaceae bacterium]
MRRVALSVLALLATSLVPLPVASADSTVVVNGRLDFPEDDSVGEALVGCDDLFTHGQQGSLLYIGNTDPVPYGHIYWGFVPHGGNESHGFYFSVDSLAATTVAGLEFDSDEGDASGVAYITYQPNGTTDGTYWVGRAALGATDTGWQDVEVIGLTYAWKKWDPGTQTYVVPDGGSATIATFLASNGPDGFANIIIGYGCNGAKTWYDGLRVGSAGNITTYDLDREASVTSIARSAATITAGNGVTITGGAHPEHSQTNYGQASLRLEAKGAGESDFTEIAQASTSVGGAPASVVVKPTVTTQYRWRFDGALSIEPSLSPVTTVQVRTAVTGVVADRTLKPGQALVVTGKTTPKKPGLAATLWRKTVTGRTKLTTTTIKADGTFRLAKRVKAKGVWKVFVTVPASSGNLAGTSAIRKATVR